MIANETCPYCGATNVHVASHVFSCPEINDTLDKIDKAHADQDTMKPITKITNGLVWTMFSQDNPRSWPSRELDGTDLLVWRDITSPNSNMLTAQFTVYANQLEWYESLEGNVVPNVKWWAKIEAPE